MVLRTCSFSLAVVLALTTAPRIADACQYPECHSDGAVAKPADFDLSLPFKEGENVKILSGYGPNAGSSLHCRAQDGQCANDYYALDLILPDHPSYGKGQPVLAAASGTVLDAGWGTSGWASYGQRVYIQHDYGADGHKYVTMYGHLDSVAVAKGQKVAKGEVLGTLGQSCNEQLACPNFSTPHVHFALHRDSNFGGSGSGGSYGGRAVIPEPIDGHGGLSQGDIVVSKNGAQPEPPPPPPPGECGAIPPAGAILDENGPCASPIGADLTDAGGHNGHAYWTPLAHPSPDFDEGLIFILNFEQAGTYALSAHIPAAIAGRAPAATYKIAHAGGADKTILDQTQGGDVWLSLGTFSFNAGQVDQWIRIGNNYELPEHEGTKLALDAIKVEPGPMCACTQAGLVDVLPCGLGGEQTRTCDGCDWGPWSPCSDGGTTGDVTGGSDGSTNGTGGPGGTGTGDAPTSGPTGTGGTTGGDTGGPNVTTLPASSGPQWGGADDSGGCACSTDLPDRTWPFGLLLLLLVAPRRRSGRGA